MGRFFLLTTLKRLRFRFRALFQTWALGAALLLAGSPARAVMLDLVDIPTAEAVDHYGYNLSFRFYSGGGVLTKTTFGVLPRLNVGFGLDTERFIGSDTVDLNAPTLNVKFRFYDGKRELPALALGYDGQGYFFDKAADEYRQREKGLYLVGGGEAFVPNLHLHAGLNIPDFSDDKVFGFTGVDYVYRNVFAFMFEADNLRGTRQSRLNLGGRYFITPSFSIDLAGRDLWAAGRKSERIVRLAYFGSF